jgi:hypothetical protein
MSRTEGGQAHTPSPLHPNICAHCWKKLPFKKSSSTYSSSRGCNKVVQYHPPQPPCNHGYV